jgi:hypothetical protein
VARSLQSEPKGPGACEGILIAIALGWDPSDNYCF